MIVHAVAERVAVVYRPSASLGDLLTVGLKQLGFTLIEVPTEEHHRFVPANLVVVEPGVVIMPGEARVTVKALEAAGVKVIGFDSSGIMQGGTNDSAECITMELDRDDGPRLHA